MSCSIGQLKRVKNKKRFQGGKCSFPFQSTVSDCYGPRKRKNALLLKSFLQLCSVGHKPAVDSARISFPG